MGTSLLAVVGPSVSGKTSAAHRAAVRLAGGVVPGERGPDQAVIRPGARPLHGCAARPAATMKERAFPPGTETVVCVAQPVIPPFTPDGAYVLAVTPAGVAYRWDLRPDSMARRARARSRRGH